MPKILINEIDNTKPGAPDSYSNYSVLVAGFIGNTADNSDDTTDKVLPDSNGIYEFTSYQKFKKTIGLTEPKQTITIAAKEHLGIEESKTTVYHYGNQMAYELLKMGYTVIYAPISSISDLTDENFWAVFKDKASYDFRFITHGLLESSSEMAELASSKKRLAAVNNAISVLKNLAEKHEIEYSELLWDVRNDLMDETDDQDKYENVNNDYIDIRTELSGCCTQFTPDGESIASSAYQTYYQAAYYTNEERSKLEKVINTYESGSITSDTFAQANACIANLARYNSNDADNPSVIPGRGDCIALIEIDEKAYLTDTSNKIRPESLIMDAIDTNTGIDPTNGKYCALTVPSVYYKMAIDKENPNEFNNNVKFPGSFHYLACFKNSLNMGFAEWYAAAGYTRGVSSYVVDTTSVKLGEIAINALEPRNYIDDPQIKHPKFACNVIAHFRGSYYLWGNRTAHPIGRKGDLTNGDLTASSFLNIRNLCATIKKQLYVSCRSFTFDPNSDTLWINFINSIKPTLEAMKADQGIKDYRILKQYTDKKATLKAKIRIIPIEAVEDFDLEIYLEDSFGETTATVAE